MTSFLLASLLFLGLTCRAQHVQPLLLPVDSATQAVTYTGMIPVPGASPAELYSHARDWFTAYFTLSPAGLELDARTVGKLTGSGYTTFYMTLLSAPVQYKLWRTITVAVREGGYGYEITAFCIDWTTPASLPAASGKTPIEGYLDEKAHQNATLWDKAGNPKKTARTILVEVAKAAATDMNSLHAAMTKATAEKKEW